MTISEAALQKALHQMEQVLLELVRSEDGAFQEGTCNATPAPQVTFSDEAIEVSQCPAAEAELTDLLDSGVQPPRSSTSIPIPGGPRPRLNHGGSDLTLVSSQERQRETSAESAKASETPSRWGRQVSWMAEQSRAITQNAMQMDDDFDGLVKFQLHAFFRNMQEDNFSHRNSRRPSICTLTAPVFNPRQSSGLNNTYFMESWAALSIFMIFLDSFRVPLLAFHRYGVSWGPLALLDMLTLFFWLANIPVTFLTKRQNTLIVPRMTWLGLEAAFAASCIYLLAANVSTFGTLLRGVSLLRIAYIPSLWDTLASRHVQPWIQRCSREARFVLNLLLALLTGSLLLHCLTCVWYAVGARPAGWVQEQGLLVLAETDRYRIALEWALSRLPPSRLPENMLLNTKTERGMAVLATTCAMVFASIFTSIVTNDMSDIRRFHHMQQKSENQVLKYLRTYPIPWELEKDLKGYLHRNRTLVQPPNKEEMASLLPDFLYRELCREALSPVVEKHDFLFGLRNRYPAFHMDICVECLSDWHLATEEILFSAGPRCHSMMFVASGDVTYLKSSSDSMSPMSTTRSQPKFPKDMKLNAVFPAETSAKVVKEKLVLGDWMCEQCLWTEWQFVGRAVANAGATVLCLGDEKLTKYANLHREVIAETLIYARLFVETLNDVEEDDLTDLPITMEDVRQSLR